MNDDLRICKVKSKNGYLLGYFHCWEQYSEPIEASPLIGGPPAGVYSRIYGIVELGYGVCRVQPYQIVFCDKINANLNATIKLDSVTYEEEESDDD